MTLSNNEIDAAQRVLLKHGMLATELVEGMWTLPGEEEPDAVVTYSSEPSPETGHAGWVWWARGKMGDADSYKGARDAAEDALRRLVGR